MCHDFFRVDVLERHTLLASLIVGLALTACAAGGGDESINGGGGTPSGGTGGDAGSAGGDVDSGGNGGTGGGNDGGTGGGGNGGTGGSGDGGGPPPPDGGPVGEPAEVYAHNDKTLYRIDPLSKTVEVIGNFSCYDGSHGMLDIAIDRDRVIIGSVQNALVKIDNDTAHCEVIATTEVRMTSLTFVPAGTLDETQEILVGYDNSDYIRFDKSTGATTKVGTLNAEGASTTWVSSGDAVSIIGGGTYLTAYKSPDKTKDWILQVNPKTGRMIKVIGNTGHNELFGLGYWGGVAYGFSKSGVLCRIDLDSGEGVPLTIQDMPSGVSFWGAGVTTAAPVTIQ